MHKLFIIIFALSFAHSAVSEQFKLLRFEAIADTDRKRCIYEGGYSTIRDKDTVCRQYIQKF